MGYVYVYLSLAIVIVIIAVLVHISERSNNPIIKFVSRMMDVLAWLFRK